MPAHSYRHYGSNLSLQKGLYTSRCISIYDQSPQAKVDTNKLMVSLLKLFSYIALGNKYFSRFVFRSLVSRSFYGRPSPTVFLISFLYETLQKLTRSPGILLGKRALQILSQHHRLSGVNAEAPPVFLMG